ncbi:MAG: cadherin-like domain-containing protein [Microcoleaceae cyanobacterium]
MSGTGINDLGFQITSENSIQAYFANQVFFSSDLTIIFEKSSLGNRYVLSSFGFPFGEGGQFSVQATEDNTEVNVTLPDGQAFSQIIDAGETLKFATGGDNSELGISVPLNFDLTGTLIQTNAPSAVFSGHSCTEIGEGACDHIVEQMPPVDVLSNSYIVGRAANVGNTANNNLVRVVAAEDNTQVIVDSSVVRILNAGEYDEFVLAADAIEITTSQPALVAQYLQGIGGFFPIGQGDPAMTFVPGQNSWLDRYQLAAPADSAAFDNNFINVVIPSTALDSLELNSAVVDTSGFIPVGSSDFSVGNLEIDPGLFTVEAAEPFQVSLFGFDLRDSYLTFGASAFATGVSNTDPILVTNDGLTVDRGTVSDITSNLLQFTDTDNTPNEIIYTVTDLPNNGNLLLDEIVLNLDDTFTQAEIDTERLIYDHDGSETIDDSFDFQVSDGVSISVGSSTFNITINPIDTIDNGTIQGTKWSDLDRDGSRNNEPGLPGVQIYLDLNDNGILDNGEPVEVTDESGEYEFTNLSPGSYIVREVVPEGSEQTFPIGSEISSTDFYTVELSADQILEDINFGNSTPPDLVIDSVTLSTAEIILGDGLDNTLEVSWTVSNQGGTATTEDWSDQVYLSTDQELSADDVPLDALPISDQPLDIDQTYSETLSIALQDENLPIQLPDGTYYILIETDTTNTQIETNEDNNVSSVSFSVSTLDAPTPEPTPVPEPTPEPDPATPDPVPTPTPEPTPTPTPVPTPNTEPTPEPPPEPEPEPTPYPIPTPTPSLFVIPYPDPLPTPSPEP